MGLRWRGGGLSRIEKPFEGGGCLNIILAFPLNSADFKAE